MDEGDVRPKVVDDLEYPWIKNGTTAVPAQQRDPNDLDAGRFQAPPVPRLDVIFSEELRIDGGHLVQFAGDDVHLMALPHLKARQQIDLVSGVRMDEVLNVHYSHTFRRHAL